MTADTSPAYIALGDSMSIDDYSGGAGTGAASLLYRNRDHDFPQWRTRDLVSRDEAATLLLLASDAATTETLLDVQLPRLLQTRIQPSVVTLTIGGNDVLSAYGSTSAARQTIERVTVSLAQALEQLIPLLAPGGAVVIGTVYDPSDGTGDATRLGLAPWPDAVRVIAELNDGLRRVATEHGAAVAEIHDRFLGHAALAGDPARPEPRPAQRDLWLCHVIEPNAWGASGIREAFWAALSRGNDDGTRR
jgi:lysophospholipase L1-like esterase